LALYMTLIPWDVGTEKFKSAQLITQKHLGYRTTMLVAIDK
jgi:hypothetical protein